MNIFLQTILFFLFAFAVAKITIYFRVKLKFSSAVTRKIFHIVIFTAATFVLHFLGPKALFIYGIIVVLVILPAISRSRSSSLFKALVRSRDEVRAKASVLIPLVATALGGIFSLLLFGRYALLGILISGWADGLAEPVGTKWGKIRYDLYKRETTDLSRSLEGSLAFVIAGLLAIVVGFQLLQIPFAQNFLAVLLIVVTATFIEALSPSGTDNFTVQAGVSGLAFFLFHNNF